MPFEPALYVLFSKRRNSAALFHEVSTANPYSNMTIPIVNYVVQYILNPLFGDKFRHHSQAILKENTLNGCCRFDDYNV